MSETASSRRHFLAAAAAGAGLAAYGAAASGRAADEALAENPPAYLDVRDFGAKLDGVTDDTQAIQAAINAAQDRVVHYTGIYARASVPTVLFPPGDCLITNTLYWKSCSLIGLDPALSTRILWGGPDGGGPAFYKPTGYPGGGWVMRMEGMSFQNANPDLQPGTWLFIDELVDKFSLLRRLHFSDCRSDAIVVANGWVNLHWEHLRWDNIGGYAIHATAPKAQHLSSFVLRNFTYDHKIADKPSEGFLLVDNKANETNIGTVSLSGARIEINEPWRGKKAFVTYRLRRAPSGKSCGFFLSDIDYQDGVGMPDDCLLYIDCPDPSRESLMIQNCRVTGLGKVLGGNWVAGEYLPPLPRDGSFALTTVFAGDLLVAGDELMLRGPSGPTPVRALSTGRAEDTARRFALDHDGRLSWGGGTAEADTALYPRGQGRAQDRRQARRGRRPGHRQRRAGRHARSDRRASPGLRRNRQADRLSSALRPDRLNLPNARSGSAP